MSLFSVMRPAGSGHAARHLVVKTLAVAALAVVLPAGSARAGLTSVDLPRHSTVDQAHVLDHVYGGHFVAEGNDFSNGQVTAVRVSDNGAGATDQVWSGDVVSARAVAAFGSKRQSFGIIEGASGGSYTNLFDVHGRRYRASGSAASVNLSGPYRFAHATAAGVDSSAESDNPNQTDRLITYQISGAGLGGAPTWLLFWEDRSKQSDLDSHELVVEVKTAGEHLSPQAVGNAAPNARPIFIPMPTAFRTGMTCLLGLAVLGVARRFRRSLCGSIAG